MWTVASRESEPAESPGLRATPSMYPCQKGVAQGKGSEGGVGEPVTEETL